MALGAAPRSIALPGAPPALRTADAPPPSLPGEHFAAALAFFVCGALGLAVVAPDLADGAFYRGRVVAVVHLFTLGWIILSIFGALCQFLPVAVGRPLRFQKAAHVSFALQVSGAVTFVAALLSENATLLHIGACALSGAFVLFAANLAATLAPAKDRPLTWWALAGAAVFLVVTPAYGVVLALNLHDGMLGAARFAVVAAHAHIALVGVVLLVMVGVAHRLLPMFMLSHGASERPGWIAVASLFTGALLLAVPFGPAWRLVVAAALVAVGVVAFLVQAFSFFRNRKRRAVDPGMRLAGAGLVGVASALVLAPFALTRGLADMHLLATYFVVLLGAVALFVAGHYYKIVPFIVWYDRFGPLVGKQKVPKVAELYSETAALVDLVLLVSGYAGLAVATYVGLPALARASALVFAAGAVVEAVVIARVAQRRPA